MKDLHGTQTANNLAKAFAGESQARNRYTFYSKIAKNEKHMQIQSVFIETADNERAHAKIFFDLLIKGLGKANIKVDTEYPIGYGTTEENLLYAAEGEKEEWGNVYPSFSKTAEDEGFPEIATVFKAILKIEKSHETRFLNLRKNLMNGTLYKKDTEQYWKCRNCGYIYIGTEAPKVCPACKHPQGYFEIVYNTD